MKTTLTRISFFALLASLCLVAHAQSDSVAPIEYLRPMKNSFSVGMRIIGGAKVQFSGAIGATPRTAEEYYADIKDINKSPGGYAYSNGSVTRDSSTMQDSTRPAQTSDTLWSNAPGGVPGRYYTTITGTDGTIIKTGDYLAYDSGYTRYWAANSASQILNDGAQVGMSVYASQSAGSVVNAEAGSSPGVELQMGRVLQRFKHFEWGFTLGLGVSEFNAKTNQSAAVRLSSITDIYNVYTTGAAFNQAAVPASPNQGLPPDGSVLAGNQMNTSGTAPGFTYASSGTTANGTQETTRPLSQEPVNTVNGETDGTVDGFWQIKGVYYMLRVGPMVRIPIGKRFAAYMSAGYMGAYVGSKFRWDETLNYPNGEGVRAISHSTDTATAIVDTKSNQTYVSGFYGDFNLEWWLSTRTGFYAGITYEKMGDYSQTFDNRKASVKMDNGAGFRFGIITRF